MLCNFRKRQEVVMRAFLIPLLAVVSISPALSIDSPGEAADYVMSTILLDNCEGKVVYALPNFLEEGFILESWHEGIEVPFDAWMILIDDMALANWEHPSRWVFVAPDGTMEILKLHTPPMALQRMSVEYSGIPEDRGPELRQQMIDWFEANPQPVADPENLYAWLVSGGASAGSNHIRYYGDCQFMYMTLQDDYGYLDDHIIVCFADGTNPAPDNSSGGNSNPDFDDDGDTDITYDATLAGVTAGYNDILAEVGPDDYLFIFTTDHGGSGKGTDLPPEAYLNLWNMEQLNDDVFDGWLDTFNSCCTHVIMEQCYSGGFLEETVPTTGGQPRTFGSAANGYESSWAGATYPDYDEWCYWWTGAMHGSVPPGGSYPGGALPYDPDINGDSYVDFGEAWDAAYAWDSYAQSGQEHPQYADDPTSCGSNYYLGGIITTSVEDYTGLAFPGCGLSISANPVSGSALIRFNLAQPGTVELTVFDMAGRSVSTLASGEFAAGSHTVSWDVESSPAGVYVVRLVSGAITETLRAVRF
jgi:hypothetical protein